MKLRIDGRELVAKRIDTARNRDVIELQKQSGLKLEELQEQVANGAEALAMSVVTFLSLHNAGFTTTTWDQVLDRPFGSSEPIEDEDERVQREEIEAEEAEAATDPQEARTASRPGDSEPADSAPAPSGPATS